MADEIVLYEVDDKIGIITLNRPEKLNAISRELQLALTEAFARADADPATSVVGDTAEAADNWIAERVGGMDVCVTSDIPLAACSGRT